MLTKLFSASSREDSNSPSLPPLSHSKAVTEAPQEVGVGNEGNSFTCPSKGEENAPEFRPTALP